MWTEEEYRAHGWHRKSLRLRAEAIEGLKGIARELGVSESEAVARLVEEWIKSRRAR